MKKPTLRRSGLHMITVDVRHHLASRDIAAALCTELYGGTDCDDVSTLTREQAERHVRKALAEDGFDGIWSAIWSRDDVDDTDLSVAARRAVDTVRRLWPELDDRDLASFEGQYCLIGGLR